MQKMMRLDKYLADAGYGTRSEVKLLIRKSRVSVNGLIMKQADLKIDESKDKILVDGKAVDYQEICWYMLHKPAGTVSATQDRHDKTVMDLLEDAKGKELFPVGRLDKDTEGLLLITNDGQMAHDLLSPHKHVEKTYQVLLDSPVEEKAAEAFLKGLDIGEKRMTRPAVLKLLDSGAFDVPADFHDSGRSYGYAEVTITEGRFHQVKRMFHAVGHEVVYLRRIRMGALNLDPSLSPGQFRSLTEEEIRLLQKA